MPTASNKSLFELTAYKCIWFDSDYLMGALFSVVAWIFIIAFVNNDNHFIHFHMDPSQSLAVGQSYFAQQNYLVV